MSPQFASGLYVASTWVIPLVIAITFHVASHGYVARLCGDDTAWRLGRVSFNPLKHIDPFGTIPLPALLMLMRSPILFGYAKPVPVNFGALRNQRRDSILVAAAGPCMNFLLATLAALAFHLLTFYLMQPGPGSLRTSRTRWSSTCFWPSLIFYRYLRSTGDGFWLAYSLRRWQLRSCGWNLTA
jgi:Zn-dependent protease